MDLLAFLSTHEVRQFIIDHESADTEKLLLNPPAAFKDHINLIVDQIVSRKKAKTKLPEWYQNPDIVFPLPLSVEQCSSPATSAYKAGLLQGEILVDLTGGMGVDTLAFAQQFGEVHHVEMDQQICKVFEHNKKILGYNNVITHNQKAEDFLNALNYKASFFIDPARRADNKSRVFHFEDCSPNVIPLLPVFRKKANQVLVKAAPMIDIALGIEQLEQVRSVHVVSVKNEVKEILFLLDFEQRSVEPTIHCVNLGTDHQKFTLTRTEERNGVASINDLKKYLYDPNSAILKAGAFKLIAEKFGLQKLATNTHLYTSDQLIKGFPGRAFIVLSRDINKKNISRLLPEGKANVIAKNHPQKPDALKNKLKIKDGGDFFIIGYRDQQHKPHLCLTKNALQDPT